MSPVDHRAILASLKQALRTQSGSSCWWVAFSGGLDSSALLHALQQWREQDDWPGVSLKAVHVNHGLSPYADQWQSHCQTVCNALDVPLIVERVSVQNRGKGLEAAARKARYAAFEQQLGAGDTLLTAHHQDDQAETLLLRLLRGAGTRGMAAMDEARPLGKGQLLRPLLSVSRQSLQNYARHYRIAFCDDDSNSQQHFDRNYLRQSILPLLRQRWPQLTQTWARSAQVLADNEEIVAAVAAKDLAACQPELARLGWRIQLAGFSQLPVARRNNVIRYWCDEHALPLPEYRHLQLLADAITAYRQNLSQTIALQWSEVALRQFRDSLYLLPAVETNRPELVELMLPQAEGAVSLLPNGSVLKQTIATGGLRRDLGPLIVRWRQGGERCHPAHRRHSQTLKKCLQEYGLEPWLRDCVPLIFAGEKLVAVADLWVEAECAVGPKQPGWCWQWYFPGNSPRQ